MAVSAIGAAYTVSITVRPPIVTSHNTGPFACNDLPSATCKVAVLSWNAVRNAFGIPASESRVTIVASAPVSIRNCTFVPSKFPVTNTPERVVELAAHCPERVVRILPPGVNDGVVIIHLTYKLITLNMTQVRQPSRPKNDTHSHSRQISQLFLLLAAVLPPSIH